MGFEAGWTDGASRSARLRMLGNAVVPAQGALAVATLADRLGVTRLDKHADTCHYS